GGGLAGWPVRARGLDARAAQEPPCARGRLRAPAAAASRADARAGRARGLGAPAAARGGRAAARLRLRRRARSPVPRRGGLCLSVALRGLRDPGGRGAGERRARGGLVALL